MQTSAHDVRVEAKSVRKARQQVLALRRQESLSEQSDQPFLNEEDMKVRHDDAHNVSCLDVICRNCVYIRLVWILQRKLQKLSLPF